MGAGCFYTHSNGQKAAWVDIPEFLDELEQDDWYWTQRNYFEGIANVLESIGYDVTRDDPWRPDITNGLIKVTLESTYYSDGVAIQLESRYEDGYSVDDERLHRLAVANFDAMESKIHRALQKAGYSLRIATSGYTSTTLEAA